MSARTPSLFLLAPKLPKLTSLALTLLVGTLGCRSEQEQFDYYLQRADTARLEVGAEETVAIELLNALSLRPDSAEVNSRLGEVREQQGLTREALRYYEEAHYLDPESIRPAVALALLLRSSEPERATTLVKSARERDPENPRIHAAEAELALDRESPLEAIEFAERSVELDPDFALGYWALGRAHMGQILLAQILEERPVREHFVAAEAAFTRHAELVGPTKQWMSLIQRARTLASWPGHSAAAKAVFLEAMAAADEHAPKSGQLRVALRVLQFARAHAETELRETTLERLLELEPDHLDYWDELALIREASGSGGGETLRRLIEEQPDNPEAQLRYAGYLRATHGMAAATEYLMEIVENEEIRPTILGALLEMYDGAGDSEKRDEALRDLEDDYPFHPITLLSRAQLALQRGRVEEAVLDLRDMSERKGGARSAALLARAEFVLGQYRASLDASSRAIAVNPLLGPELLELRAAASYALGDYRLARRSLMQLFSENRLSDRQQVNLARCFYKTDREKPGRRLLRALLSQPTPPVEAVFEFALREMDSGEQRPLLRRKLEDALARDPDEPRLVLYLAEAQRRDGLLREGLQGLDLALGRAGGRARPELLLQRARLHSDAGDLESAQRDAARALELDPALRDGLKFYISTLASLERYDQAIAALEQRRQSQQLDADRTAVLGRLYLKAGKRDEGREALLRAYQMGCRLNDVLNTLALMLAKDGELLEEALEMARQAAKAERSPIALDTLGYVSLRLGDAEAALRYFERAIKLSSRRSRESETTVATFHFRRGRALQELGRVAEASAAFERAHTLDPSRPLSPPRAPDAPSRPNSGSSSGSGSGSGSAESEPRSQPAQPLQ